MTQLNELGHGMGQSWEEKDWPHISLFDIDVISNKYSFLKGNTRIIWKSPRPFSSAALVTVESDSNQVIQTYFIKRSHHSFRSRQDILLEHSLIEYLATQNIPVTTLCTDNDNNTAVQVGEWIYEVFDRAQGYDLYADQQSWTPFFYPEHAAQAGKLLANMHLAMTNFPFSNKSRCSHYLVSNQNLLLSDEIVGAIQKNIEFSPTLSMYFENKHLNQDFLEYVSGIHQRIKFDLQQAPKIWTHNDLHASNLFWSEKNQSAKITAVIDFGLADQNSALYDLAVTIERNFIAWLDLEHTNDIRIDELGLEAFIKSYCAESTLSQNLLILADLIQIVHLDFAFSELEYFVAITRNRAHADAAYFDWIIGHTQWFASEQGQQFTKKLISLIQKYSVFPNAAIHAENLARPQLPSQNDKV
ncbi:hypothetical protein A3K93_14015 (plasmid) [Acinetobacter sp. NCu2D-2]|uniref:phosphotransferase enzyme family protein n=1 Tax=Acinetobacter sp. NCu2D-2 TaxID=1608473 RepID=UPI0007CDE1AD|nr:phosphotransferase [Acinetobacter sp. NCu2D-2]ANF83344.1 hypothetical protein A3K93_14015 [Acinetobacter sp. NCu2D-2]